MKRGEAGFIAIETIVVVGIMAFVAVGATMSTFQVTKVTERSNASITAVYQVQSAGYWISHDGAMADSVIADNLTPPDFLILKWTDWGINADSVYHSATYSIEDVSQGIGKLKRVHQDSLGQNERVLVAEYIYYDPDDPDHTTKVSYENSVLTVRLVSVFGGAEETREYKIYCRPNF